AGPASFAGYREAAPGRDRRHRRWAMMAGMGRLVGRRPDHTASIARALRSELAPGEQVVAGVYVQVPGVNEAAMSGGASGAVAAATGSGVAFRDVDGDQPAWVAAAGAMGIAPDD